MVTVGPVVRLRSIAFEWGRIGIIGFGGPPAHIALLRQLCVDDRGWLTGWGLLPLAQEVEGGGGGSHGLAKDFQALEQFLQRQTLLDDIYDGILPPWRSRRHRGEAIIGSRATCP